MNHKDKVKPGMKFGRLTIVRVVLSDKQGRKWLCACECGRKCEAYSAALLRAHTKSCKCLRKEITSTSGFGNKTHAESQSVEYQIWCGMKSRCHNQRADMYPNYGGRGIKVCGEWRNDFAAFLAHVGRRPSPLHSIGRIDNDGDYEPGNVEWQLPEQQRFNKQTTRLISATGQTKPLTVWSREMGLNASLISIRIDRLGWDPERAVNTPARKHTANHPQETEK